jgi:hypothetical protein
MGQLVPLHIGDLLRSMNSGGYDAVGRCQLKLLTHGLKAPGFNP